MNEIIVTKKNIRTHKCTVMYREGISFRRGYQQSKWAFLKEGYD